MNILKYILDKSFWMGQDMWRIYFKDVNTFLWKIRVSETGRSNLYHSVKWRVLEGTEMGLWRPEWSWKSARGTLHLMKNILWCNCHACLPFYFSKFSLAGIILFGKRSHEGGKIYCLFVYCSYSSNSHGNGGGGSTSNRSSNSCSNKMMREK